MTVRDDLRFTIKERFDRKAVPEPNTGCWLWHGIIRKDGYGYMKVKSRDVGAHRLSWELHNGPIPDGLWVLHKCDVRACVNPDHLFIGTPKANTQDSKSKGRRAEGERHPHSKLTVPQVRAIKALLNFGWGQAELAREYGVWRSTVWAISKGKIWATISSAS